MGRRFHLFSPSLSSFSSSHLCFFLLFYIILGQKRRSNIMTISGILHLPRTTPGGSSSANISVYQRVCQDQRRVVYTHKSNITRDLHAPPHKRAFHHHTGNFELSVLEKCWGNSLAHSRLARVPHAPLTTSVLAFFFFSMYFIF